MKKPLFYLSVLLIGSIFLLFVGCGDDGTVDIGTNNVYEVDPVFEPYVQEFIEEGAKRGQTIDFSDTGLRIEFSDLALEVAAGFCYVGEHHIVINKENWLLYSERFRSFLLFHELGHCELDQRHRNEQFDNGVWKSIMRGDPFTGITNRFPTPYYGFRKDYYLDELFNPNTPAPDWSKATFDYDLSVDKENAVLREGSNKINERFDPLTKDYEIEVFFELTNVGSSWTRLEWGTGEEHYYVAIRPDWGYYVGVHVDNVDNELFYSNNIKLVNGKPIEQVTIRQREGVVQVFINEEFIFHIDALPAINYVTVEAKRDNGQILTTFDIESFELTTFE